MESLGSGGPGRPAGNAALTRRELEILALVAEGHATLAIAGRLGIALNTVKSHCTNAYRKIGARNRVEAARYYMTYLADPPAAGGGDGVQARIDALQMQVDRLQARLDALPAGTAEAVSIRETLDELRRAHQPQAARSRPRRS